MKKRILTEVFSLIFIAALIFTVYVFIEMRDSLLSVIGAGVVLLITAYLLIDQIIVSISKNSATNRPLEDNTLSEDANPMLLRLEELENTLKSTSAISKKNGQETLQVLISLNNGLNAISNELRSLSSSLAVMNDIETNGRKLIQVNQNTHDVLQFLRQDQQNGVKMIIKYNKENARQLAEIDNENSDKLAALLTALNGSVQGLAANSAQPQLPDINIPEVNIPDYSDKIDSILEAVKSLEDIINQGIPVATDVAAKPKAKSKAKKSDIVVPEAEPVAVPEPETVVVTEPEPVVAPEPEPVVVTEPEPVVAPEPEPVVVTEPAPAADPLAALASGDPNKALSPDEIAALFAAASTPATPEPEPVVAPEPEPLVTEPEPAADPLAALASGDPNKALSPDEIAALFAASSAPATPEPEPVVAPEPEPVPAPAPVVVPESAPAADPLAALASGDPNKALSPDEIAALFAAASTPAAPEPEPVAVPEPQPAADPLAGLVSDDPNKKMSPDDIAALFAALGK